MKRTSVIVLLLSAGLVALHAQFPYPGAKYSRGQDVSPTFDGWQQNADGTFNFYFGYYNRNAEEEVDSPLGAGNNFDRGNGDEGQPTHFYPGRKWFVFKAVVPKDWPKDKRLVWTLTTAGRTSQAKGWLQPEWEVDQALITKNAVTDRTLGIWETNPPEENKGPSITGGPGQTITLGETATLTATATDDGLPMPKPLRQASRGGPGGAGTQGLQVRWIVYRGQSGVRFDPVISSAAFGTPNVAQTKVTFSSAGNYRLRAIACDGSVFSTYDVDVNVREK